MVNLTIKLLSNVFNVNAFEEVERLELIRSNPYQIFFRIIQPTRESIRYLPNTAATMCVKFASNSYPDPVNYHQRTCAIERQAVMAFPDDDRSIWVVQILPTDTLQYSSMTVQLTDYINALPTVFNMNVQGTIATIDTDTRKSFM